jgi:AcrR family transcriptional regulator
MLQAALDMVNRTGLTVSLDHISFEDVIRDAGVARSSAYRRWPHKDLFVSDLVRQLARNPTPALVADEAELIGSIVAARMAWLETPERRHALLIELLRQLPVLDFRTLYESPGWRTYLALHATVVSLTSGPLRDEVQASLAQSERDRLASVARAWRFMAELFGYRLSPGHAASFETLAVLVSAVMRGVVMLALPMPEVAGQRARGRPFGAITEDDWTLAALGIGGIASAFLEPDPATVWDSQRIAAVRTALLTFSVPIADNVI